METRRHNPIIPGLGVCDPHIHIFGGKAYLYATHDAPGSRGGFCMHDWQIWSSPDLVSWEQESTFRPEDTYIGPSNDCWATDAAARNGKYYYYFSDGTRSTGVAVSDRPGSGFRDALGGPLLPEHLTKTRSYDPAVFTDDDGTPYIVFGTPVWADGDSYYIARLSDDMISLAEQPRKIILDDTADDKPALHRHNGLYYLSWASHYAVSENVYGPYRYVGNTGASFDHGNFFEWNGQWFQTFTIYDPTCFHRASGICYVHYRDSGEMAVDDLIVEYGVGEYDAQWNKISAVWYMAGENVVQREHPHHGFTLAPRSGGCVRFPHVYNLRENADIRFAVSSLTGCTIDVFDGERKAGSCAVPPTGALTWEGYRTFGCRLENPAGQRDISLRFRGGKGELCHLDYFYFR